MSNNPILRPYQKQMVDMTRDSLKRNKSVCLEAPTGAGKSIILAEIVNLTIANNKRWKIENRIYFIVHQSHLLFQFSEHLDKYNIPHGLITSGHKERPGVHVHVCTYQSLIKRPPQNEPALFIIDEAHRAGAKSYLEIAELFPKARIIGVTASPERNTGEGLKYCPVLAKFGEKTGLFQELIRCPLTMLELTAQGFLSPIKYYAPPLPGLESVGVSMGDYKPKEIEKFLKEKGVYGDAINHYKKICDNTKCLVFCKTVASCYSFADSLNERGYRAAPLEGKMTRKERARVLKRFESGELTHLTTCKMVLEGFDLPAIESILDIAPTLSRAMWHQKKGRVARTFEGKKFGYYLDCAGNVAQNTEHGDIYEVVDWRFYGNGYNKKSISQEAADQYCPLCFGYIDPPGKICPSCGAKKTITPKKIKPEKMMKGDLVEIVPVPLSEREGEEKAEIQASISKAIVDNDIAALYEIGLTVTSKKKVPFWIYHKLNDKRNIVNIPLLYRIQRQLGYSAGWVWYAKKQIKVNIPA